MISHNFKLLISSPIRQLPYWILFVIFGITYLDMYDVALYIGYSIYLHPILLPPLNIYDSFFIFGTLFLIRQLIKICGFLSFYLFKNKSKYYHQSILIIAVCYLLLAFEPSYKEFGNYSIYIFAIIRTVQGFTMGFVLAFII